MINKYKNEDYFLKGGSINLFSLTILLFRSKSIIISITSISLLIAIIYSLFLPNIYISSATLKLTEGQEETSQLSQMASRYGGLASVAGISVPAGNSNGFFVVEKIKSFSFFKRILTFENVKTNLVSLTEPNASDLKLYDIYKESLSIFISKDTNFIEVSFIHHDPSFAKNLIELIVEEINDLSRKKDLMQAEESIMYLNEQLEHTQQSSLRESINILFEKELKTKMFANIRTDYIVEYIDSPYIPENRYSPSRSLICIIGIMLGLFFSISFVILKEIFLSNKN